MKQTLLRWVSILFLAAVLLLTCSLYTASAATPTPTRTATRTNTQSSWTATRTRTRTATPTRTRTATITPTTPVFTPTGTATITPTPVFTPTGTTTITPTTLIFTPTGTATITPTPAFTPTGTATITPTQGGAGTCSPVTSTITAPFTYDGTGTFCWQSNNLGGYINSWNLASLTVNGVNLTNAYVAFGSYPARIGGYWYVSYNSAVAWGHFEALGTGGGPTNTPPGPTNTPTITPTSGPTVDPHQVVNTYGRLQISTSALKDKNGNAIQLVGMDSHGLTWFPLSDLNLNNTSNINTLNQEISFAPAQGTRFPYASSAVGNLVTQWHIQVIKTTMFPYDPWNGADAKSYDNNYPAWKWYNINLVNSIVQAAIDQNIYVIIDWHAGEGNDPDPNIYWTNGHVQEFFTYMVDKWGSYPNVIYQTVNSPNNVAWADVSGNPGLKTYNQNVINFIRARETADGYAANMIIAGTPTWSQDVDVATNDPLTGNLIAYNFMWYAGTHGASIRSKADTALTNLATKAPNQTLFMSEVGTTTSNGTGGIYYSEFNTWLEWAKTKKLSWLNWSIANKQEDSAIFVPAILGDIARNEIAWRGGDATISIAEALASTGYPMRIGPWTSADYSCSGKFILGWILYNTSQPVPAGC